MNRDKEGNLYQSKKPSTVKQTQWHMLVLQLHSCMLMLCYTNPKRCNIIMVASNRRTVPLVLVLTSDVSLHAP